MLMICVILLGITDATELDSLDLNESIRGSLAVFVRERLRPGLVGTPLAESKFILHILAAYLCSPYLPTHPLFQSDIQSISHVHISADTRTAVTIDASSPLIRTWDLYTGACTHFIEPGTLIFRAYATMRFVIFDSLDVSNRGLIMGGSNQIWDLHTGTRIAIKPNWENTMINRIISDDEKIALIVSSRSLYLWYWNSGSLEEILDIKGCCRCQISSDNRVLVLAFDLGAFVFKICQITDHHSIRFTNTCLFPNLNLAIHISIHRHLVGVISNEGTIHLWNWENGGIMAFNSDDEMKGCAFTTDCAFMAIVGGNKVSLWNVATRALLIKLYVGMTEAIECMFYANNSILMITSNQKSEAVCTLDVSYLYYNDPLTMKYQFLRTIIERKYARAYFQKLKYYNTED